ncbi:MAG: DUF1653 domain-containing protein [Patescibacteria group bacterium]
MSDIYRHYKGGLYRVLSEALHTDDESEMIIYESLQDGRRWARPKAEFFGNVDTSDGMVSRFTLKTSYKNT